MKKILYAIFAIILCSNISVAQTLMSDTDHYNMMRNFSINLNTILSANCPQGMTIDQFKKKIINGELTLSNTAKTSILAYAAPLKTYGNDFAAAKGLIATTDAYKYLYSSFDPDIFVQNGKYIKNNNISTMTPVEMWNCAAGNFATNDCGLLAFTNNNSNLNLLATTWVNSLTQQIGELGVILMINGFTDCMNNFLMPDIDFIPLQDVIDTDPEITQSLNSLISQADADEYVIDSTSVTMMKYYTGRKSYSFTVVPKQDDDFLQNIVIEEGDDNIVYNYLVEHSLNTTVGQMNFNKMKDYVIDTKIHPINTLLPPNYSSMQGRGIPMWGCLEVGYYVEGDITETASHLNGYTVKLALRFVSLSKACSFTYFDIGPDNPRPIGGGRGSYTVPKAESNFYKFNTWINQSPTVKYWWDHVATPKIKKDIEYYSQYHDYSMDWCKQFVTQCMNYSELTLDLYSSYLSPDFVDLSSVSGNSPEEKKFREVYDALKFSPKFRKLFLDLFGTTPLFNAKFTIEDLPQTPNQGSLDGLCSMFPSQNGFDPYNVIRIDRNHLLTKSKVDIALTIIHECIHAYLNIKLRNNGLGMSIDNINNTDFEECINTYYNGFSGNQTQHAFIVDFMIPTIVEILMEAKSSLVTPAQASALEHPTNGGAILYQPLYQPNPPTFSISDISMPWDWKTFFKYFSYTGLDKATSYPFSYPFKTYEDYFHSKYIYCFNTIFNP